VEARINLLLGLCENLDEITSLLGVVCSEECDGSTVSASTTSTTNAVDIVLRVVRVVIVEHVSNVADILKSKG
jgi:hypothetical protein